jgi:hypothetical protein
MPKMQNADNQSVSNFMCFEKSLHYISIAYMIVNFSEKNFKFPENFQKNFKKITQETVFLLSFYIF